MNSRFKVPRSGIRVRRSGVPDSGFRMHGRAMKILLIRLRLIGDVVFTTPIPRALKRAFPAARITYLVEPAAAPVVSGNPHLDEVIVAPARARAGADQGRSGARAAAAAGALRPGDRPARRSAQRVAGAGRRGAPERIGYVIQGRTWMYTRAVAAAADAAAAALGREPVGSAGGDRRVATRGAGTGARSGGDGAQTRPPTRGSSSGLMRPASARSDELIVAHVSAGNPFRRWPEPFFADTDRGAGAGIAAAPDRAQFGSVGS